MSAGSGITQSGSSGGGGGGGALTPTSILYSDLFALYNSGTMVPGFYDITDSTAADQGVIVQSVSTDLLAINGTGLYLNPDFNGTGTYTYTPTLTRPAYNASLGIWNSFLSPVPGDFVIYNNTHYVNRVGAVGSAPNVDPTNWSIMPKNTFGLTAGYILEADFIEYDIFSDRIFRRLDKRGNDIVFSFDTFQWGNSLTQNCKNTLSCAINNMNQRGQNTDLYVYNQCNFLCDNSNVGIIISSSFNGMGSNATFVANFNSGTLNGCAIAFDQGITFADESYNAMVITKDDISTFSESIDITGVSTLDITAAYNYAGIINLTSSNALGNSITLFANFPQNIPVRFTIQSGITATFVNGTSIGQPICAGGTSAILNGTKGDTIEFTMNDSGYIYQTGGETY